MNYHENYRPLQTSLDDVVIDRDPISQLASLGLIEHEWNGKKVCEIGSGKEEALATYLADKIGEQGSLTVVNPAYQGSVDEEGRVPERLSSNSLNPIRVDKKIEEVNFAPSSFNTILGSFSVPLHLDRGHMATFLLNICLWLEPGGTARFYPLHSVLANNPAVQEFIKAPPPGIRVELNRFQFSTLGRPDKSLYQTLVIEKDA